MNIAKICSAPASATAITALAFTHPPGLDFATDTVAVRRSLDGAVLEFSADPVHTLELLPFSTIKRYPNVTVHRRAASH